PLVDEERCGDHHRGDDRGRDHGHARHRERHTHDDDESEGQQRLLARQPRQKIESNEGNRHAAASRCSAARWMMMSSTLAVSITTSAPKDAVSAALMSPDRWAPRV